MVAKNRGRGKQTEISTSKQKGISAICLDGRRKRKDSRLVSEEKKPFFRIAKHRVIDRFKCAKDEGGSIMMVVRIRKQMQKLLNMDYYIVAM